jgi:prepilin-type N-terminal cleavage/methylation domain-containing protein
LSNKGFTLIEIIVSVSILALIFVPIGSLLLQSISSNKESEEMIAAIALAQEEIEQLKTLSFTDLLNKAGKEIKTIRSNEFVFLRKLKIDIEDTTLLKITVSVHGSDGVINIVTYRGYY